MRLAIRSSWHAHWWLIALLGCSSPPSESVLDRRNREAPVQAQLVQLPEIEINGQSLAPGSPAVLLEAGGTLQITGRIEHGEWGITRTVRIWHEEIPSEGTVTISGPKINERDKPISFGAVVHGPDVDVDGGIVSRNYVQVRWLPKEKVMQFRVDLPVPKRAGEYVIDFNVTDKSVGPQRGDRIGVSRGVPIYRVPIRVKS